MKCSEPECQAYAVVSYEWLDQPQKLYACADHFAIGKAVAKAIRAPMTNVIQMPDRRREPPAKQPGWEQV